MAIWGEHPSTLNCSLGAEIPSYSGPHLAASVLAVVLLWAKAAHWHLWAVPDHRCVSFSVYSIHSSIHFLMCQLKKIRTFHA